MKIFLSSLGTILAHGRSGRFSSLATPSSQMRSVHFSHSEGMVNIANKPATHRVAVAVGRLELPRRICDAVFDDKISINNKGDIRTVAKLAGVSAAKQTSHLIPLCHQIPLNQVHVDIERIAPDTVQILVSADATARTGVEMEALTAVSIAALTIYDMTKSALKGTNDKIIIKDIHLRSKFGGTTIRN